MLGTSPILAQERDDTAGALRVFLDCQTCDFTYFRQTTDWINWVRDRDAAQVHLLITSRSSVASVEYTLEFIGRETFAGQDQVLLLSSSVTDTTDEQRQNLARVVRLGLARYASQTSAGSALDVQAAPLQPRGVAQAQADPWNFWVLSVGLDGELSGESRTSSYSLTPDFGANRTTENWKISLRASSSYAESSFEFDDGTTFINVSRSIDAGVQIVKALGGHWGVGVGGSFLRSTFYNLKPSFRGALALQYNIFPYTQSSQRELSLTYFTGSTRFDYEEETVFGVAGETLVNQGVLLSLDLKRPWGSSSIDLQARDLVQEAGQYHLTAAGSLGYRVTRGLAVTISGDYSVVRDQRFLPRRGISDEEVLLRRRALATDSTFSVGVGFSYTFGSIFNSTVNSRLTGRSGRFDRIF